MQNGAEHMYEYGVRCMYISVNMSSPLARYNAEYSHSRTTKTDTRLIHWDVQGTLPSYIRKTYVNSSDRNALFEYIAAYNDAPLQANKTLRSGA